MMTGKTSVDVEQMSKRVQLTIPDTIAELLEQWADADGRPLANLCNFLLERAVREAAEKGEIPEPKPAIKKTAKAK